MSIIKIYFKTILILMIFWWNQLKNNSKLIPKISYIYKLVNRIEKFSLLSIESQKKPKNNIFFSFQDSKINPLHHELFFFFNYLFRISENRFSKVEFILIIEYSLKHKRNLLLYSFRVISIGIRQ